MYLLTILILLLTSTFCLAQSELWQVTSSGSPASLRGVCTATTSENSKPVIWASGTQGTVLRSLDQGKSWDSLGPNEYSKLDFRCIHGWNEDSAIIASAGTPALVLKTSDAGKTWRRVYHDQRETAFFDGLKFIDEKRGVLFGDPIDGRFCVLVTPDAGESWQAIAPEKLPAVLPGEAAFAASNSAMTLVEPYTILIGTGGAERDQSRVLVSQDWGATWATRSCPLISNPSSGIFSLAYAREHKSIVAVGGDYRPEALSTSTAAYADQLHQEFQLSAQGPQAYRSAVVYSSGNRTLQAGFYATGPTGTDFSRDGKSWMAISDTGFHALAVCPDQSIVSVGSQGRFGWLTSYLGTQKK